MLIHSEMLGMIIAPKDILSNERRSILKLNTKLLLFITLPRDLNVPPIPTRAKTHSCTTLHSNYMIQRYNKVKREVVLSHTKHYS